MTLASLEITPFSSLIAEIWLERKSGKLSAVCGKDRLTLYFSRGELVLGATSDAAKSLAAYLQRNRMIDEAVAARLAQTDPLDAVPAFHELAPEVPQKQILLRSWLSELATPPFAVDEGTVAFEEEDAIEPDRRVFLQSMPVFILSGIRQITNGLVLRRSLGDLKRRIVPTKQARDIIGSLPLSEREREIAEALDEPRAVETFVKQFGGDSLIAARIVIAMTALGAYESFEERWSAVPSDGAERDLALLASIGSNDPRSMRAIGLSRQLSNLTYYDVLQIPRAATKGQIAHAVETMRRTFDPATYPVQVRESVQQIRKRLDEAFHTLTDAVRRQEYDRILAAADQDDSSLSVDQRVTRRAIAEQNFNRARELAAEEDFYGAIVLLKQTVGFAPDHAQAWFLLGSCQSRNPKWLRSAVESYHHALSLNPRDVDVMISLGDLYKSQGLISRAQSCYEDALHTDPENAEAQSRLRSIKR